MIFKIRQRKHTVRAEQLRRTASLKKKVKNYLKLHPGVTKASKLFDIPENKIYDWIRSDR